MKDFKHTRLAARMRGIFRRLSAKQTNRDLNIMQGAIERIKANSMKGDYAEFGVHVGFSFVTAYHSAKQNNLDSMRFFAFDSFKGHPKDRAEKEKPSWFELKSDYDITQENFKKKISEQGVDTDEVICVEGWWDKTLNGDKDYGIKKLACISIDCDLYSSAKLVLDFVKPFLQNGTMIIFNNFHLINTYGLGEQGAFREFEEENPEIKFYEASSLPCNQKIFYCILNNNKNDR